MVAKFPVFRTTLLHIATRQRKLQAIQELIKVMKEDLWDSLDESDHTPFMCCLQVGWMEGANFFLEKDIVRHQFLKPPSSVSTTLKPTCHPFHCAVQYGEL